MVNDDAEITDFVIKNCNYNFSDDFIKKLKSNSQTSKLSTKYEIIKKSIENKINLENKKYTKEQLDEAASKAYIYAKMVSGKFLDIRPRVDSTQVLQYIVENYEAGYKYMLEALFLKLGTTGISNYVKGKIEGASFFDKMSGVTTSQPSEIKKTVKVNSVKLKEIKNIIFQIRTKEEEKRWLDSRIARQKLSI